ncbi:MAG TPA: glycosyltransferase family A protein [Solirubrobacterales bacterium]|nr:glycosyltransferase family A protein [Solirubrobacterales bacterium]
MTPTVAVVVPCYGYAEELRGCVASVLAQRGVEVRVLIVDDASPDATPEAACLLMEGDERVEYRRHLSNAGLIATANDGLGWAIEADYVVLISADDLLAPGALHRAVEVMEARPEVGMVYGRTPYFETGRRRPRLGRRWWGTTVWPGARWIELRCRSGHNCISSPEVVVRASVQATVRGYDPACRHASDLNMWLRIAAIADVAYIRGKAQALYRVHADSMLRGMLNGSGGAVVDLRERLAAFERFFAVAPRDGLDLVALERTVRRALARQALWQASRGTDRDDPDVPVDELVAFALETCPEARSLREWWGFRLRRRIGAGRSARFPPFLATGAAHRLAGHWRRLRWRLRGV